MTGSYTVVLACCHRERDAWVDQQARQATGEQPVPITDDTYQGVYVLPLENKPRVHLFAHTKDMVDIIANGVERAA